MKSLVFAGLLVLMAAPATAQTPPAPAKKSDKAKPADARPAAPAEPPATAPDAVDQKAPPTDAAPAVAPAAPAVTPSPAPAPPAATEAPAAPIERDQMRKEILDEVKKQMDQQKQEVRDEIRAQLTTQNANKQLEDEFQQEEKKKLELVEIDGYFRFRPDLFHNFDLRRGADPSGAELFPRPLIEGGTGADGRKTITGANMRLRFEPTINVSEDVHIKAQVDVFDNLVLGSTPEGGFGLNDRVPLIAFTQSQVSPRRGENSYTDSIAVKRVWGEVMTPFGQLRAGRMGSHWGLGVLANDGNCLTCDYGDSADRVMFVTKIAGHYVVPIVDFVAEGPTSARNGEWFGQPYDRDNLDDALNLTLAIARRDSDVEINRKLSANQNVLNYGVYFVYRSQEWDAASFYKNSNPFGGDISDTRGFVPRKASAYIPDVWFKLQTQKLRIEAEAVGVIGKIGNRAVLGELADDTDENQSLNMAQFGGVVQSVYRAIDNLDLGLEVGFASGDKAPGFGNKPGRGGPTHPGDIDGYQFCVTAGCTQDNNVNNFRFNRDYRVDLILWRELLGGVTDAVYAKPTVKYEVREGLELLGAAIYSRAIYGESTPSATAETPRGDPNLGVELNAGINYTVEDGFVANIMYGVLFPLAGLNNNTPNAALEATTAQAVRCNFAIRY